jgi:hypothetical protein
LWHVIEPFVLYDAVIASPAAIRRVVSRLNVP